MNLRSHALRGFAATLLIAMVGTMACSKPETTAPGIDSEILVQGAGPVGVVPPEANEPWSWAVNSIDSVVFVEDIDSTRLEVTGFRVSDPLGNAVPGTVRFVARNAYIRYTQAFPSAAYGFRIHNPPPNRLLGKVYFIPERPFSGHTEYTYMLTTGIRMQQGALRRDVVRFRFTTGDSVAPPPRASL